MIRVLIVDDIPLFRVGLRIMLDQMGDCEIVGEATHPSDILQVARAQEPHVVLLNQELATASAIEIARLLFEQEQRGVFVLATHPTEEHLFQYLVAGAAAYEPRWISLSVFVQKVLRISRGEYLISGEALEPLVREQSQMQRPLAALKIPSVPSADLQEEEEYLLTVRQLQREGCPLTERQLLILVHIAQGMSNKHIARLLHISDQTVKNHITAILNALEVADRTAAVVEALRQRWIVTEADQLSQRQARVGQEAAPLVQLSSTPNVRYRLQKAFCHKLGCRSCQDGTGHGPYWYAYWYEHGQTKTTYLGKADPKSNRMGSPPVGKTKVAPRAAHQKPAEIRYHLQRTRCGKDRCKKCHDGGGGHGPYWFAYEVVEGKTVRRYIGKVLPAGVTAVGAVLATAPTGAEPGGTSVLTCSSEKNGISLTAG